MSTKRNQDIRNLLATQDLLRTVFVNRQGNASINAGLVTELISMGGLLSSAWIDSDTPMVSEMKMIVLRKKLVTENPEVNGAFVQKVSRETLMAMRTFLVSATLEAGKLVVQKVWEGNFNVDAAKEAKEAIAQCVKVLNIDVSTSSIWHERFLARGWDKTGDKFKEWRSQGLEYVTELEQLLIKLEKEGSDPQAIISGLREMYHIREHLAKVQWDDFKVRWNMWGDPKAVDDAPMTFKALQDEKTVWSEMTGTSDPQTVVSDLEKTFRSILDETIASILSQVTTAATQANSKDQ
ncbi:hypothetical protein FFLO_03878 [Filobasidium floriforme]|uniref:Uncharacterized protein n=1 Tax=Filobasidium floriforme TaxID=5210 RepID=A0A8K0NMU7_9TREE|nr:uncharacterized protein HD553DRAFT_345976 [Filobasidium floriforme]KAG7532070.1 hypothetical protein FFLO_03878 [Filobasidium floriforme]KAH8078598.1 hypothetical protein HD553DRAFT_345976 [Filobasidium floriforme]